MARLNNFLKFFVLNASLIFAIAGLFLIGFAIYLLAADFGDLDKDFFLGTGLITLFVGLNIILASIIGCQGVNNQTRKFDRFWTGRKVIFTHLSLMVLTLIAEVYLLALLLQAVGQFDDIYPQLEDGKTPDYGRLEGLLEEKFNLFYFGATSTCDTALYDAFWGWVDGNCPDNMHRNDCEKCESYDVTFCAADQDTCFKESSGDGRACPYTLCRTDILKYFADQIEPVSWAVFALVMFQIVVVIMTVMVLCFHPRDDLERILIKSGTLASAKHSM